MDLLTRMLPDLDNDLLIKAIGSFAIILALSILKWILTRIAERRIADVRARFNTKKSITYTFVFLGLIIVGTIWFEGIKSLATYLGLLSAGLAIALKDLIANLVGWVFIVLRKPFEVGNRIQIGEHSGDVIDIRPFQFTLLEIGNWVRADQSTGRMVHIPNGMIFTMPVSNYDSGFRYIWNEIPVLITFESDWQKAKQILQEIIDTHALATTATAEKEIIATARRFLIFYKTLTPKVYTSA
ncbi:MAG: mechanosensitive ion channel, partial [Candidatus Cloacimonadaceae bacterium]|nr:mechanosensitive ion channel [Candidatus Cloacimonadaceae bacterium]